MSNRRLLLEVLPQPLQPLALLTEFEANHATQVLRLRSGTTIEVLDLQGGAVLATLDIQGKKVFAKFLEALEPQPRSLIMPITLEMAVLKGDAMDWVIEKSVEMGVDSIAPVFTDHCVVQADRKGPEYFQSRWQRCADQALKQCGRRWRMKIELPISLRERLQITAPSASALRWIAIEPTARDLESAAPLTPEQLLKRSKFPQHLLIGPEGGWSENEKRFLPQEGTSVNLAPWTLRAETAALNTISRLGGHYLTSLQTE
jgi:16S rRNA (uracil1498-N3)-methyltransferase